MPKCKHCENDFPNWIKINGINKNISSRHYCVSCSPVGEHGKRFMHKNFDREGLWICSNCSEKFTKLQGYGAHISRCGKTRTGIGGGWNRGLTKDTDERVLESALGVSRAHRIGKYSYSAHRTDRARQLQSKRAKENGLGGYNPFPNKGVEYNGIKFHSSYEISVARSLDENHVEWERPFIGFPWNAKGNKYYPDFYLPKFNVYLDPKNDYLISIDTNKIIEAQRLNGIRVLILNKNQLNWEQIKMLL